jgi:hypothetical protein
MIVADDDIARMESIVKDVSQLRQKYEYCQDKLDKIDTTPEQCAVDEVELKECHQEILLLQKEAEVLKKDHDTELLNMSESLKKLREEKQNLKKEMISLKYQPQFPLEKQKTVQKDYKRELSVMKNKNQQLKLEIKKIKADIRKEEKFPKLVMQEGYENLQKTEIVVENFD